MQGMTLFKKRDDYEVFGGWCGFYKTKVEREHGQSDEKVFCWNKQQVKKLSQWVIILVYLLFHQILTKLGKWGVILKLRWCTYIYIYTMVINTITIVL